MVSPAMLYYSTRNYMKARECFNALLDKDPEKYTWHGIIAGSPA